jgi:hypothetical protein
MESDNSMILPMEIIQPGMAVIVTKQRSQLMSCRVISKHRDTLTLQDPNGRVIWWPKVLSDSMLIDDKDFLTQVLLAQIRSNEQSQHR